MTRPRHLHLGRSVALMMLLTLGACSGDSRPSPSPLPPVRPASPPEPPAPPPAPMVPEFFRTCIVSGWDARPVTARLVIDGRPTQTDGSGCISDEDGLRGRAIDIESPGFFPRQTRINAETVTLWPVDNAAEAAAIKAMVFREGFDGNLRLSVFGLSTHLVLQFANSERHLPAFEAAAREMNAVLQRELFTVSRTYQGHLEYWTVVEEPQLLECLPEYVFGFCLPYPLFRHDSTGVVRVHPDALADPATPLRLMAFAHVLETNPLPGVLNPGTSGMTSLSPFEQRLLRMLPLRPLCTIYPDNDRDVPCLP